MAIFVVLVALFSLSQIIYGFGQGKILSPSWMFPTKSRRSDPVGFWGSLIYYSLWVAGTLWVILTYFLSGGHLPF